MAKDFRFFILFESLSQENRSDKSHVNFTQNLPVYIFVLYIFMVLYKMIKDNDFH